MANYATSGVSFARPHASWAWLGLLLLLPVPLLGLPTSSASAQAKGPAYVIEPEDAPENSVNLDSEEAEPESEPDAEPVVEPDYPEQNDNPEQPPTRPPEMSAGAAPAPPTSAPDDDPRALEEFGPSLEPYGTWVDDPTYGQIWVPNPAIVGSEFSPYVTAGQWSLDTLGNWVWVSEYPFGSIVFHYGRWTYTGFGWGWVPGYRYAPAWVSWRVPNGASAYFGWAPLPPAFVWSGGSAVPLARRTRYYWVFCPSAFVFAPGLHTYVVHNAADARVIAHATRFYAPRTSGPFGPTLRAARIPRSAWPSVRMQPGAGWRGAGNIAFVRANRSMAPRPAQAAPVFRGRAGRR